MTRTLNTVYDDQIYNVNYGVRDAVPAETTKILFREDLRNRNVMRRKHRLPTIGEPPRTIVTDDSLRRTLLILQIVATKARIVLLLLSITVVLLTL